MKKLKLALVFIIIGSVLRLVSEFLSEFFIKNDTPFANFIDGFLLGFSVGLNLIGIILLVIYTVKKEKEDKNKENKNKENKNEEEFKDE